VPAGGEILDRDPQRLEEGDLLRRAAAGDLPLQQLPDLAEDVIVRDGSLAPGEEEVSGLIGSALGTLGKRPLQCGGAMSEETSQPRLVLQFRNAETHRELRRMAETLGVSMSELAEVAIQQELAAMEGNLERKLEDTLARLRSFQGEDPEQAAEEFARSEVTIEDPLRARRAGAEDAYGIGAAFARRVERR
jgi:hypothetical protein